VFHLLFAIFFTSVCASAAEPRAWLETFANFDHRHWSIEVKPQGAANNEKQCYSPKMVQIVNHRLVLTATIGGGDCPYVSGKIHSKRTVSYGHFEIRGQIPGGVGLWPALWLLPKKTIYGTKFWPDNGEIDLMEAVFNEPVLHTTVHTHNHYGGNSIGIGTSEATLYSGDHTYALDWHHDRLEFYFDGQLVFTYRPSSTDWRDWPFTQPFAPILNIAVGGDWGGQKGIDNSALPAQMSIGYISYTPHDW